MNCELTNDCKEFTAMSEIKMLNVPSLPNIPWQDRPADLKTESPVWRYSENPVLGRNPTPEIARIFNSAVVPWEGGYIAVLRGEQVNGVPHVYLGHSADGIHWTIEDDSLNLVGADPEIAPNQYRYDARITPMEGKYYVTWCNGYHGPTIGVAWTDDFKTFHQLENAFLPYNRNGVLFPRKVNGMYMMLSRPSDNGHTPFGDIYLSQSKDLEFWGRHRFVFSTIKSDFSAWQSTKVGPGPAPIETDEGWLLIYHGVLTTCNGFVYRVGTALLDIDEPWKVKYRSKDYLMAPWELYECVGDVPNVVFPCAALADPDTGRIAVYYGAADTYVGLAFTTVDEVVDYIKANSSVSAGDAEEGRR